VTLAILKLVFFSKQRMVNNYIHEMRRHLWIHVLMGIFVLCLLVGGGAGFFYMLFDFLLSESLQPFGAPLLNHLLGMIFLAFFSMLVFSNIIITLSTTYISRELDFFMALPIRYKDIFIVKLVESIVYSSWAFAILSLPLFMAYGAAEKVRFLYYLLTLLLVVPFLAIPAAIGAILTLLISAYLPARKTRLVSVALAAGTIIVTVVTVRILGFRRIFSLSDVKDFSEIMGFLSMGNDPVFPNYWLTQGMIAAGAGRIKEWFYWFCVILSTALMFLHLCWWLAPRIYYKGWALAKESAPQSTITGRFSPLNWFCNKLSFLPSQTRALVIKDIKTFWRDPAQWTQIIMLFGLLFIYIGNLRSASRYTGAINIFFPRWQTLLSFFNLGATCFILSIITTRFIYPMLSLEGKQFWVVGLAPMDRSKIVWEKFWLSAISAMIMAEGMMLFSNYILKVNMFMRILSAGTIVIMSFGLTSLSVGLGAITPDFREDNPARIANGFGGTINVVLSLIYIGAIISFELFPVYFDALGRRSLESWPMKYAVPYLGAFVLINLATIVLPMKIGIKKWREMEM
jgi:ABC-2 type transport system permease protein